MKIEVRDKEAFKISNWKRSFILGSYVKSPVAVGTFLCCSERNLLKVMMSVLTSEPRGPCPFESVMVMNIVADGRP